MSSLDGAAGTGQARVTSDGRTSSAATAAAKALATKYKLDWRKVTGTGPGGEVTERDVQTAYQGQQGNSAPVSAPAASTQPATSAPAPATAGGAAAAQAPAAGTSAPASTGIGGRPSFSATATGGSVWGSPYTGDLSKIYVNGGQGPVGDPQWQASQNALHPAPSGFASRPHPFQTNPVPASQFMADMQRWYYSRDAAEHQKYTDTVDLMRQAKMPGMTGKKAPSFDTVMKNFQEALIGASYNPKLTITQYLQLAAQDGSLADTSGTADQPYEGPVTTTSVKLTNETDAHAVLNDALSRYLGRNATDAEIAAFKKRLNAQEAANPTVSTFDGTDPAQRTSQDSGGVDPRQVAVDYAKSKNDYAETTASTTLMGWLMSALEDPKGF